MDKLRTAASVIETANQNIRTQEKTEPQRQASQTEKSIRKDSAAFSGDWKEKVDLGKSVSQLLDELKKQYPNISITTGDINPADLKKLAASSGSGAHLIISQGFLDAMSASKENFAEYKDILTEILEQLSSGTPFSRASGAYLEKDQVTYWTVPEKDDVYSKLENAQKLIEDFKKQMQDNLSGNSSKINTRYTASSTDYDTAGKYSQLAGAASRSAVQTVMGDAQRSIGSLRLVSCLGDKEEQAKARAAIRSLQKLLLRGRKKISRIREEEILSARKKRAQERREEERVRKMKAELKKKQQARLTADGAIRMEGKLGAYESYWRLKARIAQEEQWDSCGLSADALGSVGLPDGGGMADAGIAGGGGFTAGEVIVSAPISF